MKKFQSKVLDFIIGTVLDITACIITDIGLFILGFIIGVCIMCYLFI